ncbi:MAG: hypothetical protein KGI28_01470 [Thaumarchaeota archaeon]|nr:hypothetical protein [Nitrososphaerota archaeon]
MTSKIRILGVLLILPLFSISAVTAFVDIPSASALTKRDYYYLNDQHTTASYGNSVICGDHYCAPGEYSKMQQELSQAQQGKITPSMAMSGHAMMSSNQTSMTQMASGEMVLKLSNANLPIVIPLVKGLFEGKDVFYITTEASDSTVADGFTKFTNFPVTYAPALGKAPASSLANIYAFKNGVKGSGPLGYQPNVVDSIPGQSNYSPLWKVNLVEWKDASTATILGSEKEIMDAFNSGKLTIAPTTIVVNCPIIQWGGSMDGTISPGHMMIRDSISESGSYGSAQVLNIDTTKMQVTFVAHRGFAPDGSTIYYIATDASMKGPADALGIVLANKTQNTISTSAAADLYQFSNGIKGSGPLGYQSGVGSTKQGDQYYSPMWRIQVVTWKDPTMATVLENSHDISSKSDLTTTMEAGFIVNCPFFSADTVYAHIK